MKLRNKKTGEIREVKNILVDGMFTVNSLAELNEEWEDYEEPKDYWAIDIYSNGAEDFKNSNDDVDKFNKEIGNYFETREEAEKAVEKLMAWKRLKDNSWKLVYYNIATREASVIFSTVYTITKQDRKDLELLFGGEE